MCATVSIIVAVVAPPPYAVVQVAIPASKRQELLNLATENGQALSAYVRMIIYQHLREKAAA